jgi:dTDP-4-amino-4,6-dideoxy-D-galactose acyltransferase
MRALRPDPAGEIADRPTPAYRLLPWDSDLLGVAVARITAPEMATDELREVLTELRSSGVRLCYWPSCRELPPADARQLGGLLVDRKTVFAIDFGLAGVEGSHAGDGDRASTPAVEPYAPWMPVADLEALAVESGRYSRFAVDPGIPRRKFEQLYRTWLRRSLAREIALETLVIRRGGRIAGLITLGEKNHRGDIGLLAVGAAWRGRGYGKALLRAARRWFVDRGYSRGQVVTQAANLPACALYAKCGYAVEKVDSYYHFWL